MNLTYGQMFADLRTADVHVYDQYTAAEVHRQYGGKLHDHCRVTDEGRGAIPSRPHIVRVSTTRIDGDELRRVSPALSSEAGWALIGLTRFDGRLAPNEPMIGVRGGPGPRPLVAVIPPYGLGELLRGTLDLGEPERVRLTSWYAYEPDAVLEEHCFDCEIVERASCEEIELQAVLQTIFYPELRPKGSHVAAADRWTADEWLAGLKIRPDPELDDGYVCIRKGILWERIKELTPEVMARVAPWCVPIDGDRYLTRNRWDSKWRLWVRGCSPQDIASDEAVALMATR